MSQVGLGQVGLALRWIKIWIQTTTTCLLGCNYTQFMGQFGFGPKGPKLGQVGLGWPLGSIEIGLVSVIGPH